MERSGVISRVQDPAPLCAGIVVNCSKKNGGVQICVDLKALNECVPRETYPIPKATETSTVDRSYQRQQNRCEQQILKIPFARKSTKFITPFGRYSLNKLLPFGILSVPPVSEADE